MVSSFTNEKLSAFDAAPFTDTLKLQNASGTSNALEFPSGHMISEGARSGDWYFYGNRASGQFPFIVRSHVNGDNFRNVFWIEDDGRLYSPLRSYIIYSHSSYLRINIVSCTDH